MPRDELAKELIENLEKANADPAAADEADFERTKKVKPIVEEDEEATDDKDE